MKAVIAAASMVLLGTAPIWAALGKTVSSVADDQKRLGGEVHTRTSAGFAVAGDQRRGRHRRREYVSPAGEVFGVSWRERRPRPNLVDLLGDHYPAFRDAPRPPGHRRGPLAVRTDHLVVEMGGRMRDFHGRAYLPDSPARERLLRRRTMNAPCPPPRRQGPTHARQPPFFRLRSLVPACGGGAGSPTAAGAGRERRAAGGAGRPRPRRRLRVNGVSPERHHLAFPAPPGLPQIDRRRARRSRLGGAPLAARVGRDPPARAQHRHRRHA